MLNILVFEILNGNAAALLNRDTVYFFQSNTFHNFPSWTTVSCFAIILWYSSGDKISSSFLMSFSILPKTRSGGRKLWPVTGNTSSILSTDFGALLTSHHDAMHSIWTFLFWPPQPSKKSLTIMIRQFVKHCTSYLVATLFRLIFRPRVCKI